MEDEVVWVLFREYIFLQRRRCIGSYLDTRAALAIVLWFFNSIYLCLYLIPDNITTTTTTIHSLLTL
jgi:hypothetical protein